MYQKDRLDEGAELGDAATSCNSLEDIFDNFGIRVDDFQAYEIFEDNVIDSYKFLENGIAHELNILKDSTGVVVASVLKVLDSANQIYSAVINIHEGNIIDGILLVNKNQIAFEDLSEFIRISINQSFRDYSNLYELPRFHDLSSRLTEIIILPFQEQLDNLESDGTAYPGTIVLDLQVLIEREEYLTGNFTFALKSTLGFSRQKVADKIVSWQSLGAIDLPNLNLSYTTKEAELGRTGMSVKSREVLTRNERKDFSMFIFGYLNRDKTSQSS
ncbi:MAG: hypothetical protein Q9M76_02115 [Candidatus Dojkabacteria bacterium]|nr:hypothetical protein [Candidatus Dojkabacteria bacterium]